MVMPWKSVKNTRKPCHPEIKEPTGASISREELVHRLNELMRRTVESGAPNCNQINETLRNLPHALTNLKTIAYEVSRLKRSLESREESPPRLDHFGLTSKLCTASDLESSWAAFWIKKLHMPFRYHRKNWELCFVLQSLHESLTGLEGKKGLGFACGVEPIPSCLALMNATVTATDAPFEVPGVEQWARTQQHSSNKDSLFHPDIVSRADFDARVSFEFVDMNRIPAHFAKKFDFCWSVCAAEHLGSIEKAMMFIEQSLGVLVPGGVAVHTLEFNLDSGETIDNWPTVLFQQKHIEELEARIARAGGTLLKPDFGEGGSFFDQYVDPPPFDRIQNELHLKLVIDGFRCTCIGLIVKKN